MRTNELEEQAPASSDGAGKPAADEAARPPLPISRRRLIFVDALIVFTTLLLVIGIFSVWANRMLFNPDNWSNTSTQLLNNSQVRATTANYLVDELYANVDVAGVIKSGLPPRLQPLAAPAAGAVRNAAVQAVEVALTRPRVQNLWAQANRAADQTFITVVNGGKGPVGIKQGVVTLDLGSILNNVASRLGLSADVSNKLPANVANLTVLKSDQLKLVQNVGNGIKGLALTLTILTPLLYALAIFLAPGHRRRTLMTVGFAMVVAGTVVLLGRSIMESQIAGALTNDASLRPTITAVISITTQMLSEIAGAAILLGIPLILAGWFAGPAAVARSAREAIAPFLREHPAETYAITVAVMVLVFIWNPIPATGKPAGIIVFLAVALLGTYVLRRQTAREFPDARLGAATAKLRARIDALREHRRAPAAPVAQPVSVPEQLQRLADMHRHGDLSADEFRAAKSQLLHTAP